MTTSSNTTLIIDNNNEENIDNKELIKINSNMESIENDNIDNQDKDTFAAKVKSKSRSKSWAEQATPPPSSNKKILDNPKPLNDLESINDPKPLNNSLPLDNLESLDDSKPQKDLISLDNCQEMNTDTVFSESNHEENEPLTPFQQQLLNRIEWLEQNQDILIDDNDKQKIINSSQQEEISYYLNISILIHATNGSNQENFIQFITRDIPLQSNNYQVTTFCDINEKNGEVKYDDTKLIEFLKKREPEENFNEKHISYWINKAIRDNYIVNLDIVSVKIYNDNNHIKSKLQNLFTGFREEFKFRQALQKKIEEDKQKRKKDKPKFYLNSKNINLDNNDHQSQAQLEFNEETENSTDNFSFSDQSEKNDKDDEKDDKFQYVNENIKYKNNYQQKRKAFCKLTNEEKEDIIEKRSSKDCWRFLKYGNCQFGDQCHYKHDESKKMHTNNYTF